MPTPIECPVVSAPGIFRVPPPVNEPVRDYAPGSPERASLQLRLEQMKNERIEIPLVIGGKDVETGNVKQAVMPHDKDHVLADVHQGGAKEVEAAIKASAEAWEDWHRVPWEERAADLPPRGRAARRPVARHAERRDDARPVEDGAPGRDRRRLRADRLLALQPVRS